MPLNRSTEITSTPPPVATAPRMKKCKACDAPPVKDPKGRHKCAACRTELTDDFAAKLPGIKAELRRGLGFKGDR